MDYQITVEPGGQQFVCRANEPILRAALRSNILMPYSCRGGLCGTCRGKVISGEIHYPGGAPVAISEFEMDEGYALFCCARPASDLIISAPKRATLE